SHQPIRPQLLRSLSLKRMHLHRFRRFHSMPPNLQKPHSLFHSLVVRLFLSYHLRNSLPQIVMYYSAGDETKKDQQVKFFFPPKAKYILAKIIDLAEQRIKLTNRLAYATSLTSTSLLSLFLEANLLRTKVSKSSNGR